MCRGDCIGDSLAEKDLYYFFVPCDKMTLLVANKKDPIATHVNIDKIFKGLDILATERIIIIIKNEVRKLIGKRI
jgi:hypothetical protein